MFELNQQCVIENVLPNRGKNEDSPVLLHIKLRVDALSPEAVAAAMRARGPGEVQQSFFSDGKPRFPGVDVIPIDNEYLAKHVVTFDELEQVRVSKLFNIRVLALIEGHFSATLTITVEDPSAEYLHYITNHENKSVNVALVQDVRELDFNGAEADPVAAGKKPGRVKKSERRHEEQAPLIN